jgi:alkaline phosphatase D
LEKSSRDFRKGANDQRLSRRDFFKIAAGAGLSLPFLFAQTGCAPAFIDMPDPGTGLSLGYTAGEVTPNSAMIWLRALPDATVAVHYGKDPSLSQFATTSSFNVREESDFTASIVLQNLQANSPYYYRAVVEGRKPGPIARFVTAPSPDDFAKVTFCFSGDTRESYKPFTVMDAVRAQQPNFFLHLGDTIYADRGGSARTLSEFWAKYRANRADPFSQLLLSETSVYVTWDDHEVEDNYLPGNPLAPTGRRAFLDYWPIRRDTLESERIYRSFRWGKALELFILDARQYRDPANGTMLGRQQKEWLFSGLATSTALFKFIATSVPLEGGGSDRWDGFPKERREILRYIGEKKIHGVVFLSADLHCAAIARIAKSNGLKDITAGPMAAPLNRVTSNTAKRFEFFLAQNFNFAKITVDPQADPAHALVEFIDQDNRLFHSAKIAAV